VSLVLLPAVDVADGRAVRLAQGAAGSETSYGDLLAAALEWQRGGAEWVNLVDLDAAATGQRCHQRSKGDTAGRRGHGPQRHPRVGDLDVALDARHVVPQEDAVPPPVRSRPGQLDERAGLAR
jgi:hypothetical protein